MEKKIALEEHFMHQTLLTTGLILQLILVLSFLEKLEIN